MSKSDDELDELLRELGVDPDNLPEPSDDLDKLLAEVDELVADLNAKNPPPPTPERTGDPELDALLAELETSTPEPLTVEETEQRRSREAGERFAVEGPEVTLAALLEGELDHLRGLYSGVPELWSPLLDKLAEAPGGAISEALREAFLSVGAVKSWLDRSIFAARQADSAIPVEQRPGLFQSWLIAGLDATHQLELDIWRLEQLHEVEDPAALGRSCLERARSRPELAPAPLARLLSLQALRLLEAGRAEEALDHARESGALLDRLRASERDEDFQADRQQVRDREVAALFALERLDEAFRVRGEPQVLRPKSELEAPGIARQPRREGLTPKQAALDELGRRAGESPGSDAWLHALATLAELYAGTPREARLIYYLEWDLARAMTGDPQEDHGLRTVLAEQAEEQGWTVLTSALKGLR